MTSASAFVRAIYADGYVDELTIPVEYSYAGQLSVISAAPPRTWTRAP